MVGATRGQVNESDGVGGGSTGQLLINPVGVEKVTEISRLNGGKSVVEEGELSSACFAGSPFSEAR
jgi:hypothetical protein